MKEGVSVIMPTFNQAGFIRRAILSLFAQSLKKWELILVNDGSTDNVEHYISDLLDDERVTYICNKENRGLGYALNQGLDIARYNFVSYLPSDDFYFENHFESLLEIANSDAGIAFVYSGMKLGSSDVMIIESKRPETLGIAPNYSYLQLVQVLHRKNNERWTERSEFVTADLFEMYWSKLLNKGAF